MYFTPCRGFGISLNNIGAPLPWPVPTSEPTAMPHTLTHKRTRTCGHTHTAASVDGSSVAATRNDHLRSPRPMAIANDQATNPRKLMGLATAWRGAKSARRKRLAPWRSTTTPLHPTSRSSSMLDVMLMPPLGRPSCSSFPPPPLSAPAQRRKSADCGGAGGRNNGVGEGRAS